MTFKLHSALIIQEVRDSNKNKWYLITIYDLYLVCDIKPPNHQSYFPQFFQDFFSVLAFEKENKLFIGPKIRKKLVLEQ